jgi:endonuclease/exonuclease/phosphatase family metal-dependent hydrolase
MLSYNILDGGGDRRDALETVIESQRPDIVALVEAEELSVVEQIANRLGMDFIVAPGNRHASALMSRWPIRETINHALLRKNISTSFLEAVVAPPGASEWTVGVVHLHARANESDEQEREKEITVILDVFAKHRAAARPHLVAGDFNANAPYQSVDLSRCKPKTKVEAEANGGVIPRRAVQTVLDAGYRDSLREADPRAAENLGTFTTEFPGQRVDFIFTHGIEPRRIARAWIEQGDVARRASDHFPIGLEILP